MEPKTLSAIEQPLPTSQKSNSVVAVKAGEPDPNSPEEVKAWLEKSQKQDALIREHRNDAWKTPIEFYGRVVDENNNAVANAQVDFDCNDLSESGTSFYHTASDLNGLFSIKDIKGKILGVYVSKAGYYSYHPAGDSFEYADNHVTSVGKDNPVVFRLRKKGEGADLIHLHTSFKIPKDGTPVLVNLATGKTTSSSDSAFKVECWTHDNEKKAVWKFDWKCRVSVPGGGLQIYDEQFPFLAPEDAYVPEEIIDMPVADNPQWSQDVRRKFYIKTADGKFARMEFRMIAHGDHFFQTDSFFNPADSRNLEPK